MRVKKTAFILAVTIIFNFAVIACQAGNKNDGNTTQSIDNTLNSDDISDEKSILDLAESTAAKTEFDKLNLINTVTSTNAPIKVTVNVNQKCMRNLLSHESVGGVNININVKGSTNVTNNRGGIVINPQIPTADGIEIYFPNGKGFKTHDTVKINDDGIIIADDSIIDKDGNVIEEGTAKFTIIDENGVEIKVNGGNEKTYTGNNPDGDANEIYNKSGIRGIIDLFPFMSQTAIDEIGRKEYEKVGILYKVRKDIIVSMSENVLDEIAIKEFDKAGLKNFDLVLYAYISRNLLEEIARKEYEKNGLENFSLKEFDMGLSILASDSLIYEIAKKEYEKNGLENFNKYLYRRLYGLASAGLIDEDLKEHLYARRIKQLDDYAEYKDDNVSISFTYELKRRDLYEDMIKEYKLDSVTAGLSDTDLMIALLNWVCDNFIHNGSSGMPPVNSRNAISIINYYKENPGGINCRGLAMLLAELLRLYGIEAKHITCYPKENPCSDVHVVTQAYSKELDQWILLDPTFRLYLTDENGNYLNLESLRKSFANNDKIFANENAGHNDEVFDIDTSYKEFMVNYLFRFTCGTNFSFGMEEGLSGNTTNMLVPVGYSEDIEEITTTSSNAFWVTP